MGFQISCKTGDAGDVIVRGCPDGTVEFVAWKDTKNAVTGEITKVLCPYKYYSSIEQAFNRIFSMRVASCDADSIKALVQGIKAIRAEIKLEMGSLI